MDKSTIQVRWAQAEDFDAFSDLVNGPTCDEQFPPGPRNLDPRTWQLLGEFLTVILPDHAQPAGFFFVWKPAGYPLEVHTVLSPACRGRLALDAGRLALDAFRQHFGAGTRLTSFCPSRPAVRYAVALGFHPDTRTPRGLEVSICL